VARRRRGRPVDGILVVNKPAGMTSNAVLQQVKAAYFAAKAGHTGSLDPLATGVLPLCFGEATKFSRFLLDSDKAYRATVQLGVETDTGDADGEVIAECDVDVALEQIEPVLARFRGTIDQVPPMYSALKYQGRPLYELAREGVEIEREARRVEIYSLELEAWRPDCGEMDIAVRCSKGTYVRTLAEDLGRALGCGAHVKTLHRSQAGPFTDGQAVSLEAIEALRQSKAFAEMDGLLLPVVDAMRQFPRVELPEATAFYLRQGLPVMTPGLPGDGFVALLGSAGEFLGVGEMLDDGRVAPRRLMT